MTEIQQLQLDYWTAFHAYFRQRSNLHITTNPQPCHWTEIRIDRPPHHFSVLMNTQLGSRQVGVQLVMEGEDRNALFQQLYQDRKKVESEVGYMLHWEIPSGTKQKISLRWPGADPTDRDAWPDQHAWLLQTVDIFHRVFAPRL